MYKGSRRSRTELALDIPQQLRHAPFENDHFDGTDALGLQPCVYAL